MNYRDNESVLRLSTAVFTAQISEVWGPGSILCADVWFLIYTALKIKRATSEKGLPWHEQEQEQECKQDLELQVIYRHGVMSVNK